MRSDAEPSSSAVLLHLLDRYILHHHILQRLVLPVARGADNLFRYVVALHDFTENRVLAGEPLCGRYGDEKLRAIGIGAGVGHGQLAGLVEAVRRALGFVFKLIARASETCACWVATLDHEIGNHAVKDGAVVEAVLALLAADRVTPLALAFSEVCKIGYGFRRLFFEEPADDGAFRGIKDCVST